MPKYTGKTYSKSRKQECKSSSIFDEVKNDVESKTTTGSTLDVPKKSSWTRISKAVEYTKEQSPKKKSASKGGKKNAIVEKDPFAFSDDDDVPSRSSSGVSCLKSGSQTTDPAGKSTDDEAYSSSQETIESSQKSRARCKRKAAPESPFKSFLKNNDKSLSPSKAKNPKRLSVLPTNVDFDDGDSPEESSPDIPPIVRSSSWPQRKNKDVEGAIKVKRTDKPLFTVVKNVKKVSECLESGEDQEFFDDVEYLLYGLESSKVSTRCLSALDIMSRCTNGSFRVNLRAHGTISKIFNLLKDAGEYKNLSLCTSAIMYILTQDRQFIDFDKFILEMLIKFISVENSNDVDGSEDIEYNKYIHRIKSILNERNRLIPGTYFELHDISTFSLARESLLSITTERVGPWFKEEVRSLGALDHIIDTISESVNWVIEEKGSIPEGDQNMQAKIIRIDKCLKLLENVTYQNTSNQTYLLHYQKGLLARSLSSFTRLCVNSITEGLPNSARDEPSDDLSVSSPVKDSLLNAFKLFLNLSNDSEEGSNLIGQQEGFLSTLLFSVLQLPQYYEASQRFDLHVLGLGLLINLVEHSKQNIALLLQLQTEPSHESQENCSNDSSAGQLGSIEALMQLFVVREKSSRDTDQMTSALSAEDEEDDQALVLTKDGRGWVCGADIDSTVVEDKNEPSSSKKKVSDETLEDEIGKALVIAGKHMEDSMVASYVALLLGCIVQDNKANEALVHSLLPNQDFSLLVDVLRKFLGFMRLTSGTSGHAIEKIVKVLQGCLGSSS
ncbi:wings apart-like protein homolog [Nematostella vectensis]|uniref:wings apart-like protein homolog n=1 Tax=Nematostella vectensis TaxID=45351 RepID=UPI002077538B|nr:wings apart-like protein homolog [Nematostella vectensis]